MKSKFVWIAAGVILVIGAGAGYAITSRDKAAAPTVTTQNTQSNNQAEADGIKTACDIFTQEIAADILGHNAKKVDLPSEAQVSTEDISVSNCGYDNGSGDIKSFETANVLVRAAKNKASYETNKFGFESGNPSGQGVTLNGIGDRAVYEPSLGQVYVLVDGGKYWIIAQAGDHNAALSEKLARAVVQKL